MPQETVGSAEALLQLVYVHQSSNGRRLTPLQLWREISEYSKSGGEFQFYILADYDSAVPDGEFLADLATLVEEQYVERLTDGSLQVTPQGKWLVYATTVPQSLHNLRQRMARAGYANDSD